MKQKTKRSPPKNAARDMGQFISVTVPEYLWLLELKVEQATNSNGIWNSPPYQLYSLDIYGITGIILLIF